MNGRGSQVFANYVVFQLGQVLHQSFGKALKMVEWELGVPWDISKHDES
jgi:hypothetical protein